MVSKLVGFGLGIGQFHQTARRVAGGRPMLATSCLILLTSR